MKNSRLHREITNEHSYLIAGNTTGKIIASVYQQGLYSDHSISNHFSPLEIDKNLNQSLFLQRIFKKTQQNTNGIQRVGKTGRSF